MKNIIGAGETDTLLSTRRSIANEVMNDLNRAEIMVQAIAIGKTDEYDEYKEIMSSVDRSIDSLQSITTDLQNTDRLETINMFINMKNNNMSRLMTIIDSHDIEQLYAKELDDIIHLQDSLWANKGRLRNPKYISDSIANRLRNVRFRVSSNHIQ